jgi:hypothetical protein
MAVTAVMAAMQSVAVIVLSQPSAEALVVVVIIEMAAGRESVLLQAPGALTLAMDTAIVIAAN